ncbi:MAG: hypothetical protein LPK03_01860 [Pontibacter sp.]|nr:hypothetical protein [Pontibacter sp.]
MVTLRKYIGEAIGWASACFSVSAFGLNSLGLVSSQSVEYLGMNIIGCMLMIVYAVSKKAYASWVLNAVFLLVAIIALAKAYIL